MRKNLTRKVERETKNAAQVCERVRIEREREKQKEIEQYHGDWWGGLPDGFGEHHKLNGDVYVGKFKNGLKHGDGYEMYANGDKYKG